MLEVAAREYRSDDSRAGVAGRVRRRRCRARRRRRDDRDRGAAKGHGGAGAVGRLDCAGARRARNGERLDGRLAVIGGQDAGGDRAGGGRMASRRRRAETRGQRPGGRPHRPGVVGRKPGLDLREPRRHSPGPRRDDPVRSRAARGAGAGSDDEVGLGVDQRRFGFDPFGVAAPSRNGSGTSMR